VDAAGNVLGRLGEAAPPGPVVTTGSHIDTVPRGVRSTARWSVLAGLECLRTVRAAGVRLSHALEG
jgi:N-carbamoyl-L-amino-acid hydrolase